MRMSILRLSALVLALAAAPRFASAKAPAVYINDVRVDGLSGQSFKAVDVVFDDNGDVRITARGYKIAVMDQPVTPPGSGSAAAAVAHAPTASAGTTTAVIGGQTGAAGPTSGHFFIATVQPRPGAAQWEIDVYVNQVFARRFRSKEAEPYYEISKYLKPGPNSIRFLARKEPGERISTSPTDYFELVIGDGESKGGQVMLNRITSYRRTAAEEGTFNAETILTVPQP